MMAMNIYAADGGVVYAEGVGNLVIDINDADSAVKFGEWFGASISGMAFSFQIGDHGTESLDDDTLSKFNDDLMKLVNEISEGIVKGNPCKRLFYWGKYFRYIVKVSPVVIKVCKVFAKFIVHNAV